MSQQNLPEGIKTGSAVGFLVVATWHTFRVFKEAYRILAEEHKREQEAEQWRVRRKQAETEGEILMFFPSTCFGEVTDKLVDPHAYRYEEEKQPGWGRGEDAFFASIRETFFEACDHFFEHKIGQRWPVSDELLHACRYGLGIKNPLGDYIENAPLPPELSCLEKPYQWFGNFLRITHFLGLYDYFGQILEKGRQKTCTVQDFLAFRDAFYERFRAQRRDILLHPHFYSMVGFYDVPVHATRTQCERLLQEHRADGNQYILRHTQGIPPEQLSARWHVTRSYLDPSSYAYPYMMGWMDPVYPDSPPPRPNSPRRP